MDTQAKKEHACLLAVRRGMALYTRGHHVYGVYADGSSVEVTGGRAIQDLWTNAERVLALDHGHRLAKPAKYTLSTSAGVFEADSWWGLLHHWCLGRKAPLGKVTL